MRELWKGMTINQSQPIDLMGEPFSGEGEEEINNDISPRLLQSICTDTQW